jgi:hypothetical protein
MNSTSVALGVAVVVLNWILVTRVLSCTSSLDAFKPSALVALARHESTLGTSWREGLDMMRQFDRGTGESLLMSRASTLASSVTVSITFPSRFLTRRCSSSDDQ